MQDFEQSPIALGPQRGALANLGDDRAHLRLQLNDHLVQRGELAKEMPGIVGRQHRAQAIDAGEPLSAATAKSVRAQGLDASRDGRAPPDDVDAVDCLRRRHSGDRGREQRDVVPPLDQASRLLVREHFGSAGARMRPVAPVQYQDP